MPAGHSSTLSTSTSSAYTVHLTDSLESYTPHPTHWEKFSSLSTPLAELNLSSLPISLVELNLSSLPTSWHSLTSAHCQPHWKRAQSQFTADPTGRELNLSSLPTPLAESSTSAHCQPHWQRAQPQLTADFLA